MGRYTQRDESVVFSIQAFGRPVSLRRRGKSLGQAGRCRHTSREGISLGGRPGSPQLRQEGAMERNVEARGRTGDDHAPPAMPSRGEAWREAELRGREDIVGGFCEMYLARRAAKFRSAIAMMALAVLLPGCAAKIHGRVQLVDANLQPAAKESLQGIVVNMINTTTAVEQASHAATTDVDGKFESTKGRLRPGTYKVEASRIGYETETQTVEIKEHTQKNIDFKLRRIQEGKRKTIQGSKSDEAKSIQRKPGAEVEVLVVKELPGYRIKPWKTSFLVKLPKDGAVDKYTFDADLQATRFVTLAATENGAPVADATVSVNDKEIGKTDAGGELVYEYKQLPKTGVTLTVSKTGYAAWQKTGALQPGERLSVALSRRSIVTVTALTEQYGHTSAVAGVAVGLHGKAGGKTDDPGGYGYTADGTPGNRGERGLSFPGYIPEQWKT